MKKEKSYYVLKNIHWYVSPESNLDYKRGPIVIPFMYNKDKSKIKFLSTEGSTASTIIDLDTSANDYLHNITSKKLDELTDSEKGSVWAASYILEYCNKPCNLTAIERKISGKGVLKLTKIFFKKYKKQIKNSSKSIEAVSEETRDF